MRDRRNEDLVGTDAVQNRVRKTIEDDPALASPAERVSQRRV
jgi:hypothetical protein